MKLKLMISMILALLADVMVRFFAFGGPRVCAANVKQPLDFTQLNDQRLAFGALPESGGDFGRIYAANDANFDAAHLSEPLTEYVVGVEDPDNLGVILERLAPPITVGRAFTYRKHDERESFQEDSASDDDMREIGGDFALVRRTGSQVDGRTDNKGLTMVLDVDQGGLLPAVQQAAVVNLRQRLMRSELRRLITLLDANDTADSSVNWGATNAAADPDADILASLEAGGDLRGINSNVVLMGGAWVRRIAALRRSAASGAFGTGGMTPEQLASYLGVDHVIVLPTRYQSSATTKAKVLTVDVYSYFAQSGMMTDDPGNIKRFVTPSDAGALKVYVEQRLKRVLVSVEHYSRLVCASALGIRKLPTTFT